MSEDFVRDGYKYIKPVRDEYQSCREESRFINIDSLLNFFRGVVANKRENTSFQDSKKKQIPNLRDTVVPVIDIHKEHVSDWFRELAGSVPLQSLGRRVLYYKDKDKDEILSELLSNKVPTTRAIWFINMSVIVSAALAENAKKKPRALSDPTVEWTTALCGMLTRILDQISCESSNDALDSDWNYLFTLLLAMYDMDMADHWEVLIWLVDRAESISKPFRPPAPYATPPTQPSLQLQESIENERLKLKFFLHYLLRVGIRFTESELITRRLLYWCCSVLSEVTYCDSRSPGNEPRSSAQLVLDEYIETCTCPLHRVIVMSLSSLIVCLTMSCPSAAVWNDIPPVGDHFYLRGSPLDLIPYSLVALPMPRGPEVIPIRKCLTELEEIIITRGRLAELGWNRQAATNVNGEQVERSLKLLNILDSQNYYVAKELNPMEALFNLIFKDETLHVDTGALVTTLCDWAVSTHRFGIHRAIIVACLLEQLWCTFQSNTTSRQLFQDTLVAFLDNFSTTLPPFVGDQAPIDNEPMKSLVCLFGELIDRQLFDHDAYVRHFIARGAFNTSDHPLAFETGSIHHQLGSSTASLGANTPNAHSRATHVPSCLTNLNLSNNATAQHSVASEMSEENDRCSMDNPDSVRSELGFQPCAPPTHGSHANNPEKPVQFGSTVTRSPHLHFLTQFPIPQGECYAHEQNQRYQLLYGSVRARDRARSRVRHLVRDIKKLFTKGSYLVDVVQGEMGKRKKTKDREKDREQSVSASGGGAGGSGNSASGGGTATTGSLSSTGHRSSEDTHSIDRLHEDIMSRFVRLSYHDMECVISQCTPTFMKMLNGSSGGSTSNLTSDEHSASFGLNNPPSPQVNSSTMGNTMIALPGSSGSYTSLAPPTASQTHIYMPVPSSIFLFFDLIETSLNITCLISTVVDTLERLKSLFENRTQFMTLYMSYMCLRAIGILQRYQPVLLTMSIAPRLFSTLIAQVFQVKESTQCFPSERCILAYVHGLFSSSCAVRSSFTSFYGKAHGKVSAIFRRVLPGNGKGKFDPNYAAELLDEKSQDNGASFPTYAEDLRRESNSRFSFVCRAIVFVCQAETSERLNYLCSLCVELTAQCSELSSEWIGSLYAILAPRTEAPRYEPLVSTIEPTDVNMYDNLSSLIGTLLSRHCFPISDFLQSVICAAMAHGLNQVSQPIGPQLEPIIRLACHILHRLFTAESTVSSLQTASNVLTPNHDVSVSNASNANPDSMVSSPPFRISEPLLLTGALQKVGTEVLVDVLKMLMVNYDKAFHADPSHSDDHIDSTGEPPDDDGDGNQGRGSDLDMDDDQDSTEDSSDPSRRRKRGKQNESSKARQRKRRRVSVRRAQTSVHPVHFIVQRYLDSGTLPTVAELRSLPLDGLIQLVLREICTVYWVRERFCGMPYERLICENVLIDKNFSHSQARRLLHTIFYPYDTSWSDVASASDGLAEAMCHALSNLNLWTFNCAHMKFELLYKQIPFSHQAEVLGFVAQCLVSEFQRQALTWLNADGSCVTTDGSVGLIGGLPNFDLDEDDPVWLLPVLIQKLPKPMKCQIVKITLEASTDVQPACPDWTTYDNLKGIRNYWKHKNDEDKESVLLQHSIILAHPAFFSLLQICLEEADHKEALNEQIEYFVPNARDTEDHVPDNLRTRQVVQECLRLRLTLIGQRFQELLTDSETCTRLAQLLTQLISHGVTEPESNSALFFMVLDMLQTLVHTFAARNGLEGKPYQNLVKRLRRELSERPTTSGIEQIRPLLIPLKAAYTVFVTGRSRQRAGASGTAGNSSSGGSGTGSLGKAGGAGKSSGNKGSGKSSGGNRSGLFGSVGSGPGRGPKKRGFMIIGKERFAPWDIQDPSKQSALLCMHGATLTEAVLSRTEDQANRLIRHDHFIRLRRPLEFYLTPVYPEKNESKGSVHNGPPSTSKALKRESSNASSMLPPSLRPQSSNVPHCEPSPSALQASRKHGSVGHGMNKLPPRSFGHDGGVPEEPTAYSESIRIGSSIQQETLSRAGSMHSLQSEYSQDLSSEHLRAQSNPSSFGSALHVNMIKSQYVQPCIGSGSIDGHIQSVSEGSMKSMDTSKHGPRTAVLDDVYSELAFSQTEPTLSKPGRAPGKFAPDPPQIASGTADMSTSFVSAQPTATKRKRGAGRRAPVASVSERSLPGNATAARPAPNVAPGRTAAATVRAANAAANARMSSVGMMDTLHVHSTLPCGETVPDIASSSAPQNSWVNKSFPHDSVNPADGHMSAQSSRGPAHLVNLGGFIRNRTQQQQQQQQQQQLVSVSLHPHHQHQSQAYNTFADSGSNPAGTIRGSQQELCTATVYVQSNPSFDGSVGIPHSLGVAGPTTSYGDNTVSFVTSFPQTVDNVINPVRQQTGGTQNAPRYMPQLTTHRAQMTVHQSVPITGNQSQQLVPNPPPYPVSQSSHTHLTHHQQQQQTQHVIGRNPDDNFVLMLDTSTDDAFVRAGGQPGMPSHLIPRQTAYHTMRPHQPHLHAHHTQQQPHQHNAVGDQIPVQMMPQHTHGTGLGATFQRVPNPSQIHAPPHNAQTNPTQTHYSRFAY
ncbi:unnamed protein product [Echinostoma caproni]|uniref:Med12 domain-containing protein n=1 Tax=Echinostoma caproni TaxID=27848 RepID=A0A183AWX4_9TREM|nr:unnamed protein product [Echinostoma caproni]